VWLKGQGVWGDRGICNTVKMLLIFCLKEGILITTCFGTKTLGHLRLGISCGLTFLALFVLHGTQSNIGRLVLHDCFLLGSIRLISQDRRGSGLGPALGLPARLECLIHGPLLRQIHNELLDLQCGHLAAWGIFRNGAPLLPHGSLRPVHPLLCRLCLTACPAGVLLGYADPACLTHGGGALE
jgi:hypothetical protein